VLTGVLVEMGDDIDDLLDEVEATFVKKPAIKKINNRYSREDNSTQSHTKRLVTNY